MSRTAPKGEDAERLHASPNFSLTSTFEGRPYIAKDTEPYPQYWLNERYRLLLAMFSGRHGATVDQAIERYRRLTRAPRSALERRRSVRAIEDMRHAGVLVSARDDTSRYTAKIVEAYLAHRPFPRELAERIITDATIGASTEALDLAGGPGDLALALARASQHVSLLDLSRGFLNAARRRARQDGLELTIILDSCNRLVFRDEQYDLVTISQALHWMDDVMVCRGLCRCLRPGGSFFVIHGGFEVDESHPLGYLFGARSILGPRPVESFAAQTDALLRRLSLLFEALDAPDVHRVDPSQLHSSNGAGAARIVPKAARLYRQRRPMGLGFARAFLTPQHIESTGQPAAAIWKEIEARCAAATERELAGTYHWALLHFRRDGEHGMIEPLAGAEAIEIEYEARPPIRPQ